MKKFIHNLSTDVNGIAEWAIIFYTVFPLVGFIASLVYLIKKEKIKANAVFFYALMGLLINVIFYMIFWKIGVIYGSKTNCGRFRWNFTN